jgi:hypothetical protein
MNVDTSLHHRLRLKFYDFVPENTLWPVLSNGRIQEFRGPGYHSRPSWRQSYGSPISTILRFAHIKVASPTADHLSVMVNALLKYVFDPRHCQPEILSSIAAANEDSLNDLVADYASQAIRRVCGNMQEEHLADGRLRPRLENQIHHELQPTLLPFGILTRKGTAVTILAIQSPPEITQQRIAAQPGRQHEPVTTDRCRTAARANPGSKQRTSQPDYFENFRKRHA